MDPFTIAGLVAAVAGAAMQQQAQSSAASRQQAQIREANSRQQGYQRQAEDVAKRSAQEFNVDDRQDRQAQAEQAITQALTKPVEQAMVVDAQVDPTAQGNVSSDYTAARAGAQSREAASAQALAKLFGQIGGANRLRTNEGLAMIDAGNQIDRLGGFARGRLSADQVGIQQAGIPNGGTMLAGTVLQAGGTAAASGAFNRAAVPSTGASSWSGAGVAPGSGTAGLRLPTTFRLG